MRFRHDILGFVLIAALLVLTGCAQQMVCTSPNVLIGNSCCLDANSNNVCDTKEESDEEPDIIVPETSKTAAQTAEQDAMEDAADTFAGTWDRKSYNALRNLFVKNSRLKMSANEFNFLARKIDANMGILGVSVVKVEGDTAVYSVILPKKTITVSADLDEEDGSYMHEEFYMFSNLTPEAACGSNSSCYLSYALISKDQNYCQKAGEFKAECVEKFGVSKTVSAKIDTCLEIMEYYSRVECLDRLAVNENTIEPCWQATHDKQVFECMGKVAAARDDVDECPGFVSSKGYAGTRLQHAYCIMGYVQETSDTSACSLIDRRDDVVLGAMQEGCSKLNFP